MKKTRKIISAIISIVSTVILVISLATIVYSLFFRKDSKVTFIGNVAMVRVVSGSMSPTIETDQYVLISKVDASELAVGDIITFVSSDPLLKGNLNTHRIYAINGDGTFVTKGDNSKTNPVPDSTPVAKEDIVGKYVMTLVVTGAILGFMSSPAGFLTCIIVPMLAIVIVSARDVVVALSHKKEVAGEAKNDGGDSEDEKVRLMIEKMKKSGELESIIKEKKKEE